MLLFMISFMHRKCTGRVISLKTPSMYVKFLAAIRLRSTAQVFLAFLAFALYNASAFRICTPIFLFFPNKPMPIVVLSHFFCWHWFCRCSSFLSRLGIYCIGWASPLAWCWLLQLARFWHEETFGNFHLQWKMRTFQYLFWDLY